MHFLRTIFVFSLVCVVFAAPSAFAVIEFVQVKQIQDLNHIVIQQPSKENWLVRVDSNCPQISKYLQKNIVGDYSVNPKSAGAKLIVYQANEECFILEAESITLN